MTNTYNRRQFLAQSAAAAGGVVAAGAAAQLAGATPAGAVTKGGTLTVGVLAEQSKPFNPTYAHMDTSGFNYARCIYDPLMVVSSNGKTVYPYLAQSVTPDHTYMNWTITARPNVKFHDGSPCNGDAIAANIEADLKSILTGTAVTSLIKGISHTKGSDTVVVHTRYKWVTFPYTLAEQQIGFIAQPETLGDNASQDPIGTGPFEFSSWNYGTEFIVTANSQYWRHGYPYLDEVVLKPIVNAPARIDALETNNADLIIVADGQSIKTLKGLGGYQTMFDGPTGTPVWSPSCNCIMMNVSKAPFNNTNLRKACAMAIDQALYVAAVDYGESQPINGIFLPKSPYYKKSPYPAYNKSAAKALVAKVPAADRKITLTFVADGGPIQQAANFVAGQLGAVGLSITLDGITQAQLIDLAISGGYECMTWSQFGGVSPDTNYPWFSTKTQNPFVNLNFARNEDPKTQTLMLQGMAATSASAREKAWGAVNTELNQIDSGKYGIPYLWTDRTVLGIAANNSVQGWKAATDPANHPVLCPNQDVFFFHQIWKS